MKNSMNNKFKIIFLGLTLLIGAYSCGKKSQVVYPDSTDFGENILSLPSGIETLPTKVIAGESYSLEADLTKKANLRVVLTNTTTNDPSTYYRWLFTYVKGWYPDNFVSKKQEFSTSKVGNNDLKIVFQGDSGKVRLDIYKNGEANPSEVKFFYWD